MTPAELARANAISFECKKDSLRQTQAGTWKVAFTVIDMDERLTRAMPGTRYQAVLVEIDDNELPIQQPAKENKEVSKPVPATLRSKDKPAGVKQEIIFTCKKCEANYSVPEPIKECPVCSWKPKRDWADMQPAQQAGIRSNDPTFAAFLKEEFPNLWRELGDAASMIRDICGVHSRADLQSGKPRVIWHQLDMQYQAWEFKERVGA